MASLLIASVAGVGSAVADEGQEYLRAQEQRSIEYLLRNISPPGAARGAVVAASSKHDPDYFYHWIRDAALVMDVIVSLYQDEKEPAQKARYAALLDAYVDFSRRNQLTPNPSGGLGEPKFNADGSAFTGSWGRPQNDGPALRAVTLTRLALSWLEEGKEALVRKKLYEAEIPARTVIKADLEFVSQHWRDTCFDLWEEISGHHIYTRMVQRRALVEGASLATRLGDVAAAGWYLKQARELEGEILKHWDSGRGLFVPTLNRNAGVDYKHSGIDASVLLGPLHGATEDGFLPVTDDRMLATFAKVKRAFRDLYPINKNGTPGVAIGRYPEDRYDGYGTAGQGNPWILLTLGFGEFLFRAANQFEAKGKIAISATNEGFFRDLGVRAAVGETLSGVELKAVLAKLRASGDAYLARVRYHGSHEGRFAEQINRHTGYQQGAEDLTWSNAAFLTALRHRGAK